MMGGASWGLSLLLGDAESLPQSLPRQNRKAASCRHWSRDCGLFILRRSCRHSSTFFHCSGCPSPAHFPGLRHSQRPQSWWGEVFFQPAVPVSLSLSLSLGFCLYPLSLCFSHCPSSLFLSLHLVCISPTLSLWA